MPRGRPRKNPIPDTPIESVNLKPVTDNSNNNPVETVTVNKKSSAVNPNQICMACGAVIPDTPNKLDLAMWLDTAPYRFNTKLNDKGRIILCHKCENHLIEAIDGELKKMGCKQKFESASSYDDAESEPESAMAEYPKLNPDAFQTFVEKNRESLS